MTTAVRELRMTPQRRAVLDVLRSCADHPTAAEVVARVRTIIPSVGPATVYRTLALLVARGEALELSLGDGTAARYDGNVGHHDHLVCAACGQATDVSATLSADTLAALAASHGFQATGYHLHVHGRCASCVSADPSARRARDPEGAT